MQKEILTIEETCELLTIGRSTLHFYVKKGVFKTYNLGTRVFLLREEVIEAIKSNPVRIEEVEEAVS